MWKKLVQNWHGNKIDVITLNVKYNFNILINDTNRQQNVLLWTTSGDKQEVIVSQKSKIYIRIKSSVWAYVHCGYWTSH